MKIFDIFRKKNELTVEDVYKFAEGSRYLALDVKNRLETLEKNLGLEYFHGDKNKPHYRSRRTRANKKVEVV